MCYECDGNPDHCAYASTCVECGKKFYGYGYNATEYPCDECRRRPELLAAISTYLERFDRGFRIIKPGQKSGDLFLFSRRVDIGTLEQQIKGDENLGLSMGPLVDSYDKGKYDYRYYLHALDFDDDDLYREWSVANPDLAHTPTQTTSRGYHVLFTMPYPATGGKSERLTLIAKDWYILVEPSIHPGGLHYQWIIPLETEITHVDDLRNMNIPQPILDKMDWNPDEYDLQMGWNDLDEEGYRDVFGKK